MRIAGMSYAIPSQYSTFGTFPSNPTSFFGPKLRLRNFLPISWRSGRFPPSFPRILALSSNDIKVGTNVEVDGSPWRVLEFLHVKPGKGAAFVRTKLRNYITGNTVEKTFRAGASGLQLQFDLELKNMAGGLWEKGVGAWVLLQQVDEANIVKEVKQYTYKDGGQYVFMDMSTYEECRLNESDLGDKKKWLKEGMECSVLSWNGRVIDVDYPIAVKYKIVDGQIGVKGDTVQGGSKPVTLETGAIVYVPLFVNVGDEILVDTRTGTYMSRA